MTPERKEMVELLRTARYHWPYPAAESDLMARITPELAQKITEAGNSLDSADDGERVAKALQGVDDGCTFIQLEPPINYEADVKKRFKGAHEVEFGIVDKNLIWLGKDWKSAYERMGG